MAGLGQSMTGQKSVTAIERQRQALEYRKAGMGFEQIAGHLGYRDASGAYRAVRRALKATIQQSAEEVRDLEVARLDAMLLALWPRAANPKGPDLLAIDRALKIMARRAALLGLDAPAKIDIRHVINEVATEYGLEQSEADQLFADVTQHLAKVKVDG